MSYHFTDTCNYFPMRIFLLTLLFCSFSICPVDIPYLLDCQDQGLPWPVGLVSCLLGSSADRVLVRTLDWSAWSLPYSVPWTATCSAPTPIGSLFGPWIRLLGPVLARLPGRLLWWCPRFLYEFLSFPERALIVFKLLSQARDTDPSWPSATRSDLWRWK